jgi:hypothetical protein
MGPKSGGTRAAHPLSGFQLHEQTGAGHVATERFIRECYATRFGSRVEAFMPRLFSLQDQHGTICGAFGLRSASRRLFLEQYLDEPIDQAIAERTGNRVERGRIVEVGHLSGAFPGAVRAMIHLLTERLYKEGYEWVSFTGTASLRNSFWRMGLTPIDIKAASPERLPADERSAWGSYYAHSPHIFVGNVKEGYLALSQAAARRRSHQGGSR